ncbi:alpha-beta hydrolase superfamily lysophospholipase [Marinilabilia salmonicolor]|nr:alpha-beta hydrolase superfamily lysophospholipase [Marinilabilia salmonicolor]
MFCPGSALNVVINVMFAPVLIEESKHIMQNREFNLVAGDGTFLIGRLWRPAGSAVAVICIVHGIGEHSGRYDQWARQFCNQGYLVYSVDLRGHGRSEGRRGHIDQINNYLDDIGSLIRLVKHNWDELPVFLYGHSMGGNLVLNFLLRKRQDFAGAIVTSPWLNLVNPPAPFIQKAASFLNHLFPKMTFPTGIKSSELSSIPEQQKSSDTDKLMHHKISVRLFNELKRSATEVLAHPSRFSIPLFFAHGTADAITDFKTTRQFSESIGDNAGFYGAKNARHELHCEPVAEDLYFFITSWIGDILKETRDAE